MTKNDDRRLDRPGGRREWTNALWAALEKVSDRELAPLSDNASPAYHKAYSKFEAVRARVLDVRFAPTNGGKADVPGGPSRAK